MAPAETTPSAISAAPNVTVPALIFSGSADGVTPPADHHIPIYQGLTSTCKSFVSITGGAHCYYANSNFNCDFGESTSSPNISITREAQQLATYTVLDPWFDFKLKGICDSYGAFLLVIQSAPGTVNETSCPSLPTVTLVNDPNQGSGVYCTSINGIAYQWYMDNQPLVGETQQCYNLPADLGATYHVEVFFDNGCVISQPITMTSGLHEMTENQVNVFPNPSSQVMTIESFKKDVSYQILDLNGRAIYGNKTFSKLHNVDIFNLRNGIYHVEITDGINTIVKQFIKE